MDNYWLLADIAVEGIPTYLGDGAGEKGRRLSLNIRVRHEPKSVSEVMSHVVAEQE